MTEQPAQQRPTIPEEGMKRLRALVQEFPKNLTLESLTEEVYVKFNEEYMQKDNSYPSVEAKVIFCTKAVKNKYKTRQPLDQYDVIVYGIDKESNFDNNRKNSCYILIEEEDKMHNKSLVRKRIDFEGKDCDTLNNVQTSCMYQGVQLIKYQNGNFKADDRAIFGEPQPIEGILQMLRDTGMKEVTISEAANNFPADIKTPKMTFSDKNDQRIIHAMVGKCDAKDYGGSYLVNDESVEKDNVVEVDHTNYLIKSGFRIWCKKEYAVVDRDREAYFVGTFAASKGSKAKPKPEPYEVTMNACLVVPDHAL